MPTAIRGEQLDLTDVLSDLGSGLDAVYLRRDGTVAMTGTLDLDGNIIDMGSTTITATKIGNWDTAFGWGDHAGLYATAAQGALADTALQSFTETDPIFAASDVAGVTTADITNWDTAFGWGDHASGGYITTVDQTHTALGSVSGTADIDLATSRDFSATFTGATTITISNPPASGTTAVFMLEMTDASTNITWPAGVLWAGGAEPTWSVTGIDLVEFRTRDGGATWLATEIGIGYA